MSNLPTSTVAALRIKNREIAVVFDKFTREYNRIPKSRSELVRLIYHAGVMAIMGTTTLPEPTHAQLRRYEDFLASVTSPPNTVFARDVFPEPNDNAEVSDELRAEAEKLKAQWASGGFNAQEDTQDAQEDT